MAEPASPSAAGGRLPVTLLSGFLGAGKTTLVRHLLRTAGRRLRVAVVVNDVAALNIDAALIKGGGLSREQLVELQNGCVCCSLRLDLVQAVGRLAAAGAFDLVLLECTGVSEPLQVAEIFDADAPLGGGAAELDGGGAGGSARAARALRDVAYLDTAVTVVDAHALLVNLRSIHTFRSALAADTGDAAPPPPGGAGAAAATAALSGGHRHIAELLLEQIESANVLLLNKADAVDAAELPRLAAVLAALNPGAEVITTTHSEVDPRRVLRTGLWSAERAQGSAAWVRLLQDGGGEPDGRAHGHAHGAHAHDHGHGHAHGEGGACCSSDSCGAAAGGGEAAGLAAARPADAFGVSHFVYRARWPFHPGRLHAFMLAHFVLQEPDWAQLMRARGGGGSDGDSDSDDGGSGGSGSDDGGSGSGDADADAGGEPQREGPAAELQAVAAERRAACEARFGLLLRSKGFAWLASRGDHIGEWSQAGSLLSFSTGGPWFCVLPPGAWPDDADAAAAIRSDFAPGVGDRRQELVFIGVGLDEAALRGALDACLLTTDEAAAPGGWAALPDPFEPWPSVEELMDAGEPSDEDGDDEASGEGESEEQPGGAVWAPGRVAEITGGACELQRLLDDVHARLAGGDAGGGAGPAVVVDWAAPWAAASAAASAALDGLAAAHPGLPVVRVDVAASDANRALALEKVMEAPQAWRKGGRKFQPVPRSGEKWPCATLHVAPLLQPAQEFSGAGAAAALRDALEQQGALLGTPAQPARAAAGASAAGSAAVAAAGGAPDAPPGGAGGGVQQLQRGAADLKQLLARAGADGLLLVAWGDAAGLGELPELLAARGAALAAATGRRVLVAAADAAGSPGNAALAAALRVAPPAVQAFHNKQLARTVKVPGLDPAAALAKVEAAVRALELLPVGCGAPSSSGASEQTQARQAGGDAGDVGDAGDATSSGAELWDPPAGAAAKPGAKRRLPAAAVHGGGVGGRRGRATAVFWPRMPCLSCGCPWWLGEDWDATCARCGWSCEEGGYDDDSAPLPQHAERFAAIAAELKAGRTPSGLPPLAHRPTPQPATPRAQASNRPCPMARTRRPALAAAALALAALALMTATMSVEAAGASAPAPAPRRALLGFFTSAAPVTKTITITVGAPAPAASEAPAAADAPAPAAADAAPAADAPAAPAADAPAAPAADQAAAAPAPAEGPAPAEAPAEESPAPAPAPPASEVIPTPAPPAAKACPHLCLLIHPHFYAWVHGCDAC
ncbi:yciC [Scenedesmus sp. PABB004]|nr:yciC [Scenedesmus sp. PABB004]